MGTVEEHEQRSQLHIYNTYAKQQLAALFQKYAGMEEKVEPDGHAARAREDDYSALVCAAAQRKTVNSSNQMK